MEQYFSLYGMMFIASLTATAVLTPPIIRLARNHEIVDLPGLHKTHTESKPLLGGLAILLGFLLTVFIFIELSPKLTSLIGGALVLVVLGVLDDIGNIRPLFKLLGQVIAALVVVIFNINYYHVFLDTLGGFGLPAGITLFLLTGWIVLMINAFNLIDGLDGLASGTGGIIFTAMAVITLINGGSSNMLLLQIAGAGACFGFLLHNFNPARVFMGDTGSMLIGYLLATTYLLSINSTFDLSLVLGSLFVFAYPAMDTGFAIFRRLKNRTSIFKADRGHIHHIIRGLGFSVRKTVLVLYLCNLLFAAIAVFLLCMNISSVVLLIIGLATIAMTYALMALLSALGQKNGLSGV